MLKSSRKTVKTKFCSLWLTRPGNEPKFAVSVAEALSARPPLRFRWVAAALSNFAPLAMIFFVISKFFSTGDLATCSPGWYLFGKNCYKAVRDLTFTQTNTKRVCTLLKGSLVVPRLSIKTIIRHQPDRMWSLVTWSLNAHTITVARLRIKIAKKLFVLQSKRAYS